jgi:peptide-methionine (S)-S-oxide reductase
MGVLTMSTRAEESNTQSQQVAIFAGGCFWCEEEVFEKMPGIISVLSGYTGGTVKNPTYEQVSAGGTGHTESVKVTFDPSKITYQQLLDLYWRNVDPFDQFGQFCDRGSSYKAVIFYTGDEQKKLAEDSKAKMEEQLKQKITTDIRAASEFYPAEEYHQKYAEKNPIRYKYYRTSCGRDSRLATVWGKKPEEKK